MGSEPTVPSKYQEKQACTPEETWVAFTAPVGSCHLEERACTSDYSVKMKNRDILGVNSGAQSKNRHCECVNHIL